MVCLLICTQRCVRRNGAEEPEKEQKGVDDAEGQRKRSERGRDKMAIQFFTFSPKVPPSGGREGLLNPQLTLNRPDVTDAKRLSISPLAAVVSLSDFS